MRSDKKLRSAFGGSGIDLRGWGMSPFHSWSGHERDHLFLNDGKGSFEEASAVSGLDSPLDGRAFAVFDYDRDGYSDFAVVNANAPQMQLYRNRIGEVGKRTPGAPPVVALRFVGGNRAAAAAPGLSNRDGYGVTVTARVGGRTLVREHRCGEGLGAQNSATMRIGLGDAASAESIAVRWPSGRTHELKAVAAGTWLTAYEMPEQAPGGQPFVRDVWRPAATAKATADAAGERLVPVDGAAGAAARLRAYTTMATWCEACKNDLPQVALLRSTFAADEVAILGVPVDEGEDRAKLKRFLDQHRPAYQLMIDAPQAFRAEVSRLVLAHLKADSLPSTIVTDAEGRVLKVAPGVPTVSDLRRLLTARAE